MKRKTKVAVLVLSMLLLFSMGLTYAESSQLLDKYGSQMNINMGAQNPSERLLGVRSVGFSRIADLKATSTVSTVSTINAVYIKAEITIQKLNRTTGVYYDYDNTRVVTVRNTDTLYDNCLFKVGSSGTYRIKVVFSEDDAGEVTIFAPMYSKAEGL